LEHFARNPIFAAHSIKRMGELPDSIRVVQLILVQYVLVRIQVGQQVTRSISCGFFFFVSEVSLLN
jgi:hypothetical protein